MERPNSRLLHEWHVRINQHADKLGHDAWPSWMYMGKDLADEVPRMALLHGMERRGELAKKHVQCHNAVCDNTPQEVPDNHLRCCLGVECRACPHLLALNAAKLTPEQVDYAKAWTCAAHMLAETKGHGDTSGEGWLQTVDDRMYWARLYENMAASDPDDVSANAGHQPTTETEA